MKAEEINIRVTLSVDSTLVYDPSDRLNHMYAIDELQGKLRRYLENINHKDFYVTVSDMEVY